MVALLLIRDKLPHTADEILDIIVNTIPSVKPVPLWQALLIFGLPGIAIYLGVHDLVPMMVRHSIPLVFAWTLAVVAPTVLNASIVVGLYLIQEKPTYAEFVRRFRLQRPPWHLVWWILLVVISIALLNDLLAWTVPYLSRVALLAPPAIVPEIFADVYGSLDQGLANLTFMGETLSPGKVWLVPFWLFFWVILALLGEELVWRGYVLPGQEALYGNYAWLVNGLLWNIPFHLYTMHNFFSDMPLYFLLPSLVQRFKNTWLGIAVHALLVSLALIILVPGLLA